MIAAVRAVREACFADDERHLLDLVEYIILQVPWRLVDLVDEHNGSHRSAPLERGREDAIGLPGFHRQENRQAERLEMDVILNDNRVRPELRVVEVRQRVIPVEQVAGRRRGLRVEDERRRLPEVVVNSLSPIVFFPCPARR